jgi:hypothetical protein
MNLAFCTAYSFIVTFGVYTLGRLLRWSRLTVYAINKEMSLEASHSNPFAHMQDEIVGYINEGNCKYDKIAKDFSLDRIWFWLIVVFAISFAFILLFPFFVLR